MIVDFHAHYIPPKLVDILKERNSDPRITMTGKGSMLYHMPISTLPFSSSYYDMEERIEMLNFAGVQKQVLSLPGLLGIDYLPLEQSVRMISIFNEELAFQCGKYADRIIGLAALPLADPDVMLAELKKCIETYGFIGAILPNNAFLSRDHADKYKSIFKYGEKHKLHFFIHPGWRADEYPVIDNRPNDPDELLIARGALGVQHTVSLALITFLYTDFLDKYKNVTVHVANLGGTFPMVVERMQHTVEARFPDVKLGPNNKPNLYVDTSSLGPRAIELAVEIYGIDHIIVGTDTPIFNVETGVGAVKAARLTQQQTNQILYENAESILSK